MEKKHYLLVDNSIVFRTKDSDLAAGEIEDRLKAMFKGAQFHNPVDHTIESAEKVNLDFDISDRTGAFFFVIKANLTSDVDVDMEVRFIRREPTLQNIDGEFVHVEEYEYFSGIGSHVELLLPGKEKGVDFVQYVLKNL